MPAIDPDPVACVGRHGVSVDVAGRLCVARVPRLVVAHGRRVHAQQAAPCRCFHFGKCCAWLGLAWLGEGRKEGRVDLMLLILYLLALRYRCVFERYISARA